MDNSYVISASSNKKVSKQAVHVTFLFQY